MNITTFGYQQEQEERNGGLVITNEVVSGPIAQLIHVPNGVANQYQYKDEPEFGHYLQPLRRLATTLSRVVNTLEGREALYAFTSSCCFKPDDIIGALRGDLYLIEQGGDQNYYGLVSCAQFPKQGDGPDFYEIGYIRYAKNADRVHGLMLHSVAEVLKTKLLQVGDKCILRIDVNNLNSQRLANKLCEYFDLNQILGISHSRINYLGVECELATPGRVSSLSRFEVYYLFEKVRLSVDV